MGVAPERSGNFRVAVGSELAGEMGDEAAGDDGSRVAAAAEEFFAGDAHALAH